MFYNFFYIFILFLNISKNNFYLFSFLFCFVFKEPHKQCQKFLKTIFFFKNRKLFLNYTTKQILKFRKILCFIELNILIHPEF